MSDLEVGKIFGLLVADLRGHLQAERRAMLTCEWLAVHFKAEQCLRMQGGRHVERLVVVVGTLDIDKARGGIGANQLKEIRKLHAAEIADYIPTLNADVARVLHDAREGLNLRQCVLSWLFHLASHRKSPLVEVHARIRDVINIDGELLERRHFGVRKGAGAVTWPK